MIGAVGADAYGQRAVAALESEGIDTSRIRRLEAEQTGVAIIAVGPRGENQIVVAPGANAMLALDAEDHELISAAQAVLTNHEIPADTTLEALRAAKEYGVTAILNPAPARALPAEILTLGPILTPNEHELVVAIGNDVTGAALDELQVRHGGPIIVTQGPAGALLVDGDRRERFEGVVAPQVVDTTGAGDAFCGVLATWLAEGHTLDEAIVAANLAGALSVGAAGAREGMPRREQIEGFVGAV
jgi:ribokinase